MMDYFVFDRKPSYDFDCYLVADSVHESPKRDYKKVSVPGRNGDILIDNNRFENADISYYALFYKQESFEINLRDLKAYLLSRKGYCRLEDTFHPDEFYHAVYSGSIEPDVILLGTKMAKVQLKFLRKPQKYLKQGELVTEYTSSDVIYNPTYYNAQPFLRVYGYGRIGIGDYSVDIADTAFPYIDIDCERMDAYYGTANCNNLISASEFPALIPGNNNIVIENTIKKVEIMPRWWTV